MTAESPRRPRRLPVTPPVDVAAARRPAVSQATAPTVSPAGARRSRHRRRASSVMRASGAHVASPCRRASRSAGSPTWITSTPSSPTAWARPPAGLQPERGWGKRGQTVPKGERHGFSRCRHEEAVQTDARARAGGVPELPRLRQQGVRRGRAAAEDEGARRTRHRVHHAVPVVHRGPRRARGQGRRRGAGDRRGDLRRHGDGGGGGVESRRAGAAVPGGAQGVTRLSRLLVPTLREDPADAEVASHRLMVRSGMIRQVARGIYDLLPLGLRAVRRVETIVREEMDRAGAQEILMPAVIPGELWRESGRWERYGSELLRMRDRYDREFCFGPTHEEVVTDLVRREIRSYRELPKNLYQIQVKFRDEIRPRFGLMRGREFIMKDAYSFHVDADDARREYRVMFDTYTRIFERCGLTFRAVEAGTGAIGGSLSHEFQVLAASGEDAIVSCERCGYAADVEKAEVRAAPAAGAGGGGLERVATPGKRSVEEVSTFLGLPRERFIKTLLYATAGGEAVAILVRGDHEASATKVQAALGGEPVALADEQAVERATGAPVGFAGPVGLKVRMRADAALRGVRGAVAGAERGDGHGG